MIPIRKTGSFSSQYNKVSIPVHCTHCGKMIHLKKGQTLRAVVCNRCSRK